MSDQQRRSLDNARRAAAARKEDYLPRLREIKPHAVASWTGVSLANGSTGCPWKSGIISELSPHEIARHYFRSFKCEWEVFLSLLAKKYDQEFTCFVRDNLKSAQLANVFRRGYSRLILTPLKSGYRSQCNYHFLIESRKPINVHFFYSLLAAFNCIRETGGLPDDAPIYFFIEEIKSCRLAKSKVVFRTDLPNPALTILQAHFESEPEADDAGLCRPTSTSHSHAPASPKITRLEDGSFCLEEERGSRPSSYTTTAECKHCLKTVTLHIEMPEYTQGSGLKEACRLVLTEHLRTDHLRKRA
jgi:hypothetical protein